MIIAIDGPAASGKGTLAKRIAAHLDLPHLDTGLLYRAVARDLRQRGGNLEDSQLAAALARDLAPMARIHVLRDHFWQALRNQFGERVVLNGHRQHRCRTR